MEKILLEFKKKPQSRLHIPYTSRSPEHNYTFYYYALYMTKCMTKCNVLLFSRQVKAQNSSQLLIQNATIPLGSYSVEKYMKKKEKVHII